MKMMPNKKELDTINEAVFDKYGTDDPDVERHICVICGHFTSIGWSYSAEGRNLICSNCFHKHFGDFKSMFDWTYGIDKNGEEE